MLGLVLIYFVGKAFYELAAEHGKSQWGFAILGVLSYYITLFFAAFIIAVFNEIYGDGGEMNELLLTVLSIPFGVLACWGFYKLLQSRWRKPRKTFQAGDVLDAGFTGTESRE